ncbi:septal ring factor EnvC (AmiA/AmiB activator) [Caballeronia udeis]|uniref:Septal ring factor EnvC (AmiA/AmiB activator) n=1 Tax=Caballeronia udeis TaxID=1232866 RepID=A0ABW8MHB9_9BURK
MLTTSRNRLSREVRETREQIDRSATKLDRLSFRIDRRKSQMAAELSKRPVNIAKPLNRFLCVLLKHEPTVSMRQHCIGSCWCFPPH